MVHFLKIIQINMSIPFHSPTSILVSGCSASGKTTFLNKLLANKHLMFKIPPERILFCYDVWQPVYDKMQNIPDINFIQGVPNAEVFNSFDTTSHTLLILDDLQHDIAKNKTCEKLLTQLSHHANITVIYVLQNLYYPGIKTLTLNTHYNVLFQNLRDVLQISILSRQLGMGNALVDAYKDAVLTRKYGYLLIDLCPHSEQKYRLRTQIFPEDYTIIYEVKQ